MKSGLYRGKSKDKSCQAPTECNHWKQYILKSSQSYCRSIHLPRLIGLWPDEIQDHKGVGQKLILNKLRKALRVERQKGISGHWAYDLSRHIALLQAYKAEQKRESQKEMQEQIYASANSGTTESSNSRFS